MKLPFLKSSKTTEAEVSEKIFGVEINKDLIAQLIKIYIENSHPGTKAQKNRSAVRGGGKKPWRQKGTGRARAGTSRSPLWRGGGVVFPASTKSAKPKKLNKKMYKSAMRSIFSSLAKILISTSTSSFYTGCDCDLRRFSAARPSSRSSNHWGRVFFPFSC